MAATSPPASDPGTSALYRDPPPFALAAQGHSFTFLPGGADRLRVLLDLIGTAQHQLAVFYYLFDSDGSGTAVRDALAAAAALSPRWR